jgi:hypothetical protein
MMICPIVTVFSLLEESAEFKGLVGFVVVHGPELESSYPEKKPGHKNEREKPEKGLFGHLDGAP